MNWLDFEVKKTKVKVIFRPDRLKDGEICRNGKMRVILVQF